MRKHRSLCSLILLSIALTMLLSQCRRRPDAILTRDEMKAVTKDMVLAQSYIDSKYGMPDSVREAYYRSVLEKHGISQAKYDTSLVWYGENLPMLTKIYNQIIEELQQEAVVLDTLYQDSIRRAGLTYKSPESLWSEPSRVCLSEGDRGYRFLMCELRNGSVAGGDTLDFGFNILPGLLSSGERIEISFVTLTRDSSIVYSTQTTLDGNGDRRIALEYVTPQDTTSEQSQWHRLFLSYYRDRDCLRKIPLVLDSIYLSKHEPPVAVEESTEEESEE